MVVVRVARWRRLHWARASGETVPGSSWAGAVMWASSPCHTAFRCSMASHSADKRAWSALGPLPLVTRRKGCPRSRSSMGIKG